MTVGYTLVLKKHFQALNDDLNSQKGRVRDVLSAAKKVLRDASPNDDVSPIRERVEDLKDTMETVSKMSSDRLNALEQALPLAEHFYDTHLDLVQWMDEVEVVASELDAPSMNVSQIKGQQEKNKVMVNLLF